MPFMGALVVSFQRFLDPDVSIPVMLAELSQTLTIRLRPPPSIPNDRLSISLSKQPLDWHF
jgi:hypothetical protein